MKMHSVAVVILFVIFIQRSNAGMLPERAIFDIARIQRQVGGSDTSRCSNVLWKGQCSTSSYIQNVLNEFSQCGNFSSGLSSTAIEGLCRQNPSTGDYCGSLMSIKNTIDSLITISQACRLTLCSAECRSHLTNFLNRAGCCIVSNFRINGIVSQFYTVRYHCLLLVQRHLYKSHPHLIIWHLAIFRRYKQFFHNLVAQEVASNLC